MTPGDLDESSASGLVRTDSCEASWKRGRSGPGDSSISSFGGILLQGRADKYSNAVGEWVPSEVSFLFSEGELAACIYPGGNGSRVGEEGDRKLKGDKGSQVGKGDKS